MERIHCILIVAVCYFLGQAAGTGWADWANWSTCNGGIQARTRRCGDINFNMTGSTGSSKSLDLCPGNSFEVQTCGYLIPEHGGWSTWSDWGSCSVTCGAGIQQRDRNCSNPTPNQTGRQCLGNNIHYRTCKETLCKGPDSPRVAFNSRHLLEENLKQGDTMVFRETLLNIGNAYDKVRGVFYAPVQGIYVFYVNLCAKNYEHICYSIWWEDKLIEKGSSYGKGPCTSLNSVILVRRGETVRVKQTCPDQGLYSNVHRMHSFSGALIMSYND